MLGGWHKLTNLDTHFNGRILLIWRPDFYKVNAVNVTAQAITCDVLYKPLQILFHLTVVYVFNTKEERRQLWITLERMNTCAKPWVVIGDFNCVLHPGDKIGGNSVGWAEIVDFHNCVDSCGLIEHPHQGNKYTWNNKGERQRIYSKIGWIFINNEWMISMPACNAMFLPEGISDHCLAKISLVVTKPRKMRSFLYCNTWAHHPKFLEVVKVVWDRHIDGCLMFQVVRKLKLLKNELKTLNRTIYKNIESEANNDREALIQLQKLLQINPHCIVLQQTETEMYIKFRKSSFLVDQLYLQQRAKATWIKLVEHSILSLCH
ncbi:hypothetical protein KY290_013575 [Solanum tuberosum]|uniref:Endonuclease/exonuclease/phosphatase domain-containing protein n=1 Tax=Solanum tuberosum TaxID=4113 RepID=A0ABQ7VM54_SOLTU|nr:hypothetical protein KY289_013699 [Solanum tuberosum]KAH0717015.1 hypothetical protein KY285_013046 [Solanum tuberosum]KAH0769594.1 hypothetical protein KY290_013575 [Solanum tuberosum]